jgi:hypothetical protein
MTEIVRPAAPQTSSFQRFVPAAQASRLEYLAQLCSLARHSATPGSSKRMTRMKYISYQRVPQRCATFAGNVTKLSTMRTRKPVHLIPSVSRPASTSTWSATTTERARPRPSRTGWPAIPASTSTSPRPDPPGSTRSSAGSATPPTRRSAAASTSPSRPVGQADRAIRAQVAPGKSRLSSWIAGDCATETTVCA